MRRTNTSRLSIRLSAIAACLASLVSCQQANSDTLHAETPQANSTAVATDATGGSSPSTPAKIAQSSSTSSAPTAAPASGQAAPAKSTRTADVQLAQAPAPVAPAAPPKPADPSDEFFAKGVIPQIKIIVNPEEEKKLRSDQRRFVDCSLLVDGKTTYKKVQVKLKGAAGSFRNLDDRPAFTLGMKKKGERFNGLDKFHLNNSVQDESYLNELICSQIFREAGYPAARTTHARVWYNSRDLGFYVLKEGFDKEFVERNFGNHEGNLYDGGFCREIDQNLEKDAGNGPADFSDLKAVVAACREGDAKKRYEAVAKVVDIDKFLTFVALELMTCHWDGYSQNRNNYRIYFNNGKAVFMPHGMDQMFGDVNYSVMHVPGPLVTQAVLNNPEWKAQYNERVKQLLPLFAPARMNARIDAAAAKIRPVLASINEDRAKQFDGRVADMKNRAASRMVSLRNQVRGATGMLLKWEGNTAKVAEEWDPKITGDAKFEEREKDGKLYYTMQSGPSKNTNGTFRRRVLLSKGTYRLEATGQVRDVVPIQDALGQGLGLRLGGGKRENKLIGTSSAWTPMAHEFEIPEDKKEVELVIEFRANGGNAVVDASTIKLVKLK